MWTGINRKKVFVIGGLVIAALVVEGAVAFVASRLDARTKRSLISFRVPAGTQGFFLVPRAQSGNCTGPMVVTVPPTGRCAPIPPCAGPGGGCYDSNGRRIPTRFENEDFQGYDWENEVSIQLVKMDNGFGLGEVFYLGSERDFRRSFPGWGHEILSGLNSRGGSRLQ